jgi:hypothetical protein
MPRSLLQGLVENNAAIWSTISFLCYLVIRDILNTSTKMNVRALRNRENNILPEHYPFGEINSYTGFLTLPVAGARKRVYVSKVPDTVD